MKGLLGSTSGRERPPTPKKLNDHIYELYEPTEVPCMDILFFHGLQYEDSSEAYWSTWTCGNAPEKIWPSTWLADDFPNAHICAVSYDSSMTTTQEHGRFDLYIVVENLIQMIYSAGIGQTDRPLILVGHCFGGLVIKSLCVEADQNQSLGSRFLRNMKGIFFYGTPHRGSHLLEEAAHALGGPLMTYVKVLSTESARLETRFDALCKKNESLRIASVGESRPMSSGPFTGRLVVPEASARYGEYTTASADHVTLCRPESKTSMRYQRLESFLRSIEPKVRVDLYFHNRQRLPSPLIGLDIPVKDVEEILLKNQKVGIVGMGGIGKTTLAMAVFNKLGPKFEYTCFIRMMKKMDPEVNVQDVEKEVWDLHLHCRGKKVDNCKVLSWSALTGKRLLLVWDDVSSNQDLDVLSNIANTIGGVESRFIMTSRNEDLLNCHKEHPIVYSLKGLDNTHATQLFMRYACPKDFLESNVKDIVEKCEGLPLTLEILGCYLHEETNVNVWKQTLQDLDEANVICDPDERLWAQLTLSYKDLKAEVQEMFLDVTTFFSGTTWTLREAKAAWRAIYKSEDRRWRFLFKRHLVYNVDEDEPIRVHPQLQSLGRKIASESKKCRIRIYTEGLELLQSTNESTDELENQEIHALRIESDDWLERGNRIHISGSSFRRLKTARYLDVKVPVRVSIEGRQEIERVPIHNQVLLGCLDHQISWIFNPTLLADLVVLKISSPKQNGIEYLHTSIGQLSTLKVLKISDALELKSLPDKMSRLAQLECLRLLRCPRFETLPEDFGQLSNLKHLAFHDCDLETLPKSFGELATLEHLEFCECESLQALPGNFGHLKALKYLKLDSCYSVKKLPDSFPYLAALEHLELIDCFKLHQLPCSFGRLSKLKHLKLHWLLKLESLPASFRRLSALESLEVRRCDKLNELPVFFGELAKIQDLVIDDCCKMERLPNSLADLKHLRHLAIAYVALKSIPDSIETLPSLQTLELGPLPYLTQCPPWLGKSTLALPAIFVPRIFHVHDGRFDLHEENIATYDDWRLSSWLDSTLGVPFPGELQSETWILILQKRAIVKGINGDLCGALEDLNTAMENCVDIQLKENRQRLEYMCRKERGYIRYLLDDMKGAQEDGEAAFKHQSGMITDDILWEENENIPFILVKIEKGLSALSTGFHSGRPTLSYLDFEFSEDPQQYVDKLEVMWSSCTRAREKVRRSDLAGALVDLGAIDTRLIGFRAEAYILQERANLKLLRLDYGGALATMESSIALGLKVGDLSANAWARILQVRSNFKQLIGDCHGALEDLDAAMVTCVDQGLEALEYICNKERGYVKYLLGDMEGAREDGEAALRYEYNIIDDVFLDIGGIHYLMSGSMGEDEARLLVRTDKMNDIKRCLGFTSKALGPQVADFEQVLSYLNFKFYKDPQIYVDNMKLMPSLHRRALEKVVHRRTKFTGALAGLDAAALGDLDAALGDLDAALADLDAIDVRLIGSYAQAFILQERGILKRMKSDLDGALDDLTSAWQIISNYRLKGCYFEFISGYHSLKHRGYVRLLLGDAVGARDDAAAAVRELQASDYYTIYSRQFDFDYSYTNISHQFETEDESKVWEGQYFWRGLGSQDLIYLGFNLPW